MVDSPAVTKSDLDDFKNFLLDKFETQTSEIQSRLESATSKVANFNKRIKLDQVHTFKHKGNEQNYKFNTDLCESLEEVAESLEKGDIDAASSSLKDVLHTVKERNRKIKIADSSEGGWLTVQNYENHSLALDDDDDKRIRKAEKEAIATKTAKSSARAKRGNNSNRFRRPSDFNAAGSRPNFSGPSQPNFKSDGSNLCNFCGKSGHWWRECWTRKARFHSTGSPAHFFPGQATSSANPSSAK